MTIYDLFHTYLTSSFITLITHSLSLLILIIIKPPDRNTDKEDGQSDGEDHYAVLESTIADIHLPPA